MTEASARRWVSAKAAALYLSISPKTLRAWVSDGLVPAARIHRRNPAGRGRHICTIRFDLRQLDAFMQERTR